ncbi:hypothetical protein ACVGV7_02645, partial [Enterobacter intestinihominis]
ISTMQTAARNRSWGGWFTPPNVSPNSGQWPWVLYLYLKIGKKKKKSPNYLLKNWFSKKIYKATPTNPLPQIYTASTLITEQKTTWGEDDSKTTKHDN